MFKLNKTTVVMYICAGAAGCVSAHYYPHNIWAGLLAGGCVGLIFSIGGLVAELFKNDIS